MPWGATASDTKRAVFSMLAAVGIATKGLSKQTMEQRGSCLVLLITMDCMLKLWWDVLGRGLLGRICLAPSKHMCKTPESAASSSLCKQTLQPPQRAHKHSHSSGMTWGLWQVPLRRWPVFSPSSSPIWETKGYVCSSLWQVPLMIEIQRKRLNSIANSSKGLQVINVAGVLFIKNELNCAS